MRLRACGWFASLLFIVGCQPTSSSPDASTFDYWVLALSWSPEHCASDAGRPDSRQCTLPHGFIVHGLWPQFESGYPEFCETTARVPQHLADQVRELMPDRGLVYHQWRKHGSCSAMTPEQYFARVGQARQRIEIPRALFQNTGSDPIERSVLERELIRHNPGLHPDAFTLNCRAGYLREIRVCLDQALEPRRCGVDVREACGRTFRIRAAS